MLRRRIDTGGRHISPRVVAHPVLALLGALFGAPAAVLLVAKEVRALAAAADLPNLAGAVAAAAVQEAGREVRAGANGAWALAARLPGAPGLQAHRRGLLDAVEVGGRLELKVRQEAASPEGGGRRRGVGGDDEEHGEGQQRHEKDGGSCSFLPHGGGGWAVDGEAKGVVAMCVLWVNCVFGRCLYEE